MANPTAISKFNLFYKSTEEEDKMIRKLKNFTFGLGALVLTLFLVMSTGWVQAQDTFRCQLDQNSEAMDSTGDSILLIQRNSYPGTLQQCNTGNGSLQEEWEIPDYFTNIVMARYSPDGQTILMSDTSGSFFLLRNWQDLSDFHTSQIASEGLHSPVLSAVQWLDNYTVYAALSDYGEGNQSQLLRIQFDGDELIFSQKFFTSNLFVTDLAYNPVTGLLAAAGRSIYVVDTETLQVVAEFDVDLSNAVSFSPNGQILAVDSDQGVVILYDTLSWLISGVGAVEAEIEDLAIANGRVVVTTERIGLFYQAKIHDLLTNFLPAQVTEEREMVNSVFQPIYMSANEEFGIEFGWMYSEPFIVSFASDGPSNDGEWWKGFTFITVQE